MKNDKLEFKDGELSNHFNIHVRGTKYNNSREVKQWENNGIDTPEKYLEIARENTEKGKYYREYKYYTRNNTISINYQKGNVSYIKDMDDKKYEGLLTTCLDYDKSCINTCFYREMNYDNIELITMIVSLYMNDYKIANDSNKKYVPGIYLYRYPKILNDSLNNYINEYLTIPVFSLKTAKKRVLVQLLKDHLKESVNPVIVALKECCDSFIDVYDSIIKTKIKLISNKVRIDEIIKAMKNKFLKEKKEYRQKKESQKKEYDEINFEDDNYEDIFKWTISVMSCYENIDDKISSIKFLIDEIMVLNDNEIEQYGIKEE